MVLLPVILVVFETSGSLKLVWVEIGCEWECILELLKSSGENYFWTVRKICDLKSVPDKHCPADQFSFPIFNTVLACHTFLGNGFLGSAGGKESICQCWNTKEIRIDPLFRNILGEELATCSIFLLGRIYGRGARQGYSPWGHRVGRHQSDLAHTSKMLIFLFSVQSPVASQRPTLCESHGS